MTGTSHEALLTAMAISPWILFRMRNFPDKICRAPKHIFYVQYSPHLPTPENRFVYTTKCKNMVQADRPQMIVQNVTSPLHTGCIMQGYRHTLRIFNIYCFSSAAVVTRTHLCYITHTFLYTFYKVGRTFAKIIWTLESHSNISHFFFVCKTFPILSTDAIRLALNYIDTLCVLRGVLTRVTCNTWRVHRSQICDIEQTLTWFYLKDCLNATFLWTAKNVFFFILMHIPCIFFFITTNQSQLHISQQCVYITNKMHKILVIRVYFPLDAQHVSDCITPSSGATL